MKNVLILVMIVLVIVPCVLRAETIPPEIKNCVAFVYLQGTNQEKFANGTGFFVAVQNPTNAVQRYGYFVTAKHVLKTPDQSQWLPGAFLRLNKKDGSSDFIPFPIITNGLNQTVFVHSDPNVDLVAIPVRLDQNIFDFKFLPAEMLTSKKDFSSLNIREGSDVFFVGLFLPYPGYQKNHPIVRFGRVSLMTDERIEWDHKQMDLYLVESGSFGGNSGSPVFFSLGSDRIAGSIVIGPPVIKVAGVMMGAFQDIKPIAIMQTAAIPISQSSMGIAAVVPAYRLHELLQSESLKRSRGF